MTTQRSTIVMSISATFGIAMLLSTSGCVRVDDSPQEPEARDAIHKNVPPKNISKNAQLLVGTWERVSCIPKPNPFVPVTQVFSEDGTCSYRSIHRHEGVRLYEGHYSVDELGKEITITLDPDFPNRKLQIEEIDERKLVLSATIDSILHVERLERVHGVRASR